MPRVKVARSAYLPSITLGDFSLGLRSYPRLPKEAAILENLMIRSDGRLVSRGRLCSLNINFGAEVPRGIWSVDPAIGFNFIVATTAEWYGITITSQALPISATKTVIQAYTEGTRPTLIQGLDKAGNPAIFFCGYDGTSTHIFQYTKAGGAIPLTAWTNQMMLGYRDGVLFGGGGQSSGGYNNVIYYSAPGDPTTLPAQNFTNVPDPIGGTPLDFVVVNDTPVIVTTSGVVSLTGNTSQGFLPVERASIHDSLLARSLQASGTVVFGMGAHGLYDLEEAMRELSLPVKSFWFPISGDITVNGFSLGRGSFSSNGYFYAAILNNTTVSGAHQTSDNGLLVYDLRTKSWFLATFPNFAPYFIAPGGMDLSQGTNVFTSFAILGKDLTNTQYRIAFWQPANDDVLGQQDQPVTSTGAAATGTDYTTHYQSALLGEDSIMEKLAGELVIDGYSTTGNVTVTLYGVKSATTSQVQIQQWTSVQLPAILEVVDTSNFPAVYFVVDIQGKGT